MAEHTILQFQNNQGYQSIEVPVKEFMCVGALPPFDHPHIFLDMGKEETMICPYCSTLYRFNAALATRETIPPHCHFLKQPHNS